MNKSVILLVLVLFSIVALFLFSLSKITGLFVGFGPPAEEYEWWNVSWTYRVGLRINTTSYDRTNWPIEYDINFTELIPSGTFDENSIRVVEYDSGGQVVQELKSQFDKAGNYDAVDNALGTLAFMLDGGTPPNTEKVFFVYYGTTDTAKDDPAYSTSLVYAWNENNGEFNVNNSIIAYWADSIRGENSSGLIRVRGLSSSGDIFDWTPPLPESSRTYEYTELSNGTHNFTFDFTYNATLVHNGSVRMVVEQRGDEVFWNSTDKTNEGYGVKRYTFYNDVPWVKVELNLTNLAGSSITRNSTFSGAIGIDALRAFGMNWESEWGNTTPPGWWYASDPLNSFHSGIIHVNQSGSGGNFWVPNSSVADKIGIQLNSTQIDAGASIIETAVIDFNDTYGLYPQVRDLRSRLETPVIITLDYPEYWHMSINGSTNTTVYNRNESVLIIGNVSESDPYNATEYMNVTLDMGTPSTADDQEVALYDDGLHGDYDPNDNVFGNIFNISNSATVGTWTANFTTYSDNYEFLNYTTLTFGVTDVFNLSVVITNDKPIVGQTVYGNVYVRNYMENHWIVGATVNCSYDSSEVTNIVDQSNGTYSFDFTAPLAEGNYILTCNATQNGNFGENTDTFSSESGKTNVTIASQPANPQVYNVKFYENGSFVITANATVVQNGTAYNSNITLELQSGWGADMTFQDCGDIDKYESCIRDFNISVPNTTSPGNYSFNVTLRWTNPDGTGYTNMTEVNATVQPNRVVEVQEASMSGEVADGASILFGNFTVLSSGNAQIDNITFECLSGDVCNNFDLSFQPTNVSSLSVGSSSNVSIIINVSLAYTPGTYNGTINVTSENGGNDTFTVFASVPKSTNVSITPNIPSYTAYNITQQGNETFAFYIDLTDVKNGSARWTNISLSYDAGWDSNYSYADCGNLTKNESCRSHFNVTIPAATTPSDYYVYITANWTQPDDSFGTNTSAFTVTVASNPEVGVLEPNVTGNASDGTNTTLGNFTVMSAGNDALQNIAYDYCYPGTEVCDNFTMYFNPVSISTLAAGENESVVINVSVPLSFPAGYYNGTLNVSASNDEYENLTLFVNVLDNRTWNLTPTYCEKSRQQETGVACEINVTNYGNALINFTISPATGNYTQPNETGFGVNGSSSHMFSIDYDTTSAPPGTHNSTFFVIANQTDASPDNVSVKITLVPYIPPMMNISIQPNETYQNNTIRFFVNVTDQSASNIAWTRVNVSRPDSHLDVLSMYKVYESGNFTMWELDYPNSTDETNGSTYPTGVYNVTVYTKDNIGNTNAQNMTFKIYTKLDVKMSTFTSTYYQGDSGSIYYVARDIDGNPIENVTVSFTLYDSQGNISYLSGNLTSNQYGTISPLPTFEIPSDSPLGAYTLRSYSTYYDDQANKSIESEKNYTFQVYSRTVTVTGIFADIETAVVWYPPLPGYPTPTVKFGILVYNGEGEPVDPDYMNLTIYKPDDNVCFSTTMSSMTKHATGFYIEERSFICADSVTPTGMYLAVVNVTQGNFETMKLKAFRVAQGGPYDVRLQLLETSVEQGGVLDYVVIVENKGELRQDVHIEYWYSPVGSTERYGNWTEFVLTLPLVNESFTRTMNMDYNQPLGSYLMFAKVTYDSSQPSLIVNSTFSVVSRVSPTTTQPSYPVSPYAPTGAAPAPTPTAPIKAGLMITRYNNNISLAREVTILESVTVNNTGQTDLNNVSLFLIGMPTTWFNVTPDTYKILPEGESTAFVITMRAPKNAELTTYKASLIATSGVVSDQKEVDVNVFASLEELLRDEIRNVKRELQDLEVNTRVAEIEGKDTTNVKLLIEEIKAQIDLAEEKLDDNELDEASSSLANAKNLLQKAKDMLERLQVITVEGYVFPIWAIVAIIMVVSIIVFAVMYMRGKKVGKMLRPWIMPFGRLADAVKVKKAPKEDMSKEREKVERMLNVLEKERKEGIISAGAYKEMKKSLEKKLEKFKKK